MPSFPTHSRHIGLPIMFAYCHSLKIATHIMLILTILAIVFTFSVSLTLYLKRVALKNITNDILRITLVVTSFIVICCTILWACLWVVSPPPSIYSIAGGYSMAQRPGYSVAQTADYYHLIFYQNRSWWTDKKLGEIELKCQCLGDEKITATITDATPSLKTLHIKMDDQSIVDTTLSFKTDFNFQVSAD
ncbi:hypothetical protein [Hymenobacter negativus]|uniref:hypothetical protein n=1 Tax=Hymenobacter negativus TaxID=2795026 RepID=UPI0018DCF7D1|nr:hypothetical protein [Hymenobacter negativus]MBH8569569.1 hypothetical protein [Hymenobacter negativus]